MKKVLVVVALTAMSSLLVAQTAPNMSYDPAAGTPGSPGAIVFPAGTGQVQTQVVATPSGGSGAGAPATTTVQCGIGAQFSPIRLTFCNGLGNGFNLSFVGNTTTPQNIPLCCETGSPVQNTLTCLETRGANPTTVREWTLSCGVAPPPPPRITTTPPPGSAIPLCPGSSAAITVSNSGEAGAPALTLSGCAIAPAGTQFTVAPTALSVALGQTTNNVLIVALPTGATVPASGILSCNTNAANAPGGTVSWSLSAQASCVAPPPPPPTAPGPVLPVPAGGFASYLALLSLLAVTGLMVFVARKR